MIDISGLSDVHVRRTASTYVPRGVHVLCVHIYTIRSPPPTAGVAASDVDIVEAMARYSAESDRSSMFSLSSVRDVVGSALKGLKDVTCVFTQHESLLVGVLQKLIKGRLPPEAFPSADPAAPAVVRPTEIFVYIVGGVTYEEALCVSAFNDPLCPAVQSATAHGKDVTEGAEVKIVIGGDKPLTPSRFIDMIPMFLKS